MKPEWKFRTGFRHPPGLISWKTLPTPVEIAISCRECHRQSFGGINPIIWNGDTIRYNEIQWDRPPKRWHPQQQYGSLSLSLSIAIPKVQLGWGQVHYWGMAFLLRVAESLWSNTTGTIIGFGGNVKPDQCLILTLSKDLKLISVNNTSYSRSDPRKPSPCNQ